MSVFLPEAGATDTETIASLHATSWRDAYAEYLDFSFLAGPVQQDRLAVWTERLAHPNKEQRVTLALINDEPVGFVCTFGNENETWGAGSTICMSCPGLGQQGRVGHYSIRRSGG